MRLQNHARAIASATIIAALLAPAAYARPIDDPRGAAGPLPSQQAAPLPNNPRAGSPGLTAVQRKELGVITQGAEQAGLHPGVFGPGNAAAPRPPIVRVTAPSSGFDWGDAGVGAGAMLALSMLGLSGVLAITRRRHRVASSSPANPQAQHARV